jgi:hypothetical protein
MSNSLSCKLCSKPIKFDDKHVSHRTGRKIPLDVDTEEPHDCPVWKGTQQYQPQPQQPQQQQPEKQRRYYQCNKGCGQFIYFHESQRTENGKWMPLEKKTGEPHLCQ